MKSDTMLGACVEKLRAGDAEAFEKLYNLINTPAYTVIVRITRDEQLSEDILQELFIKLYKSPPPKLENPRAYILKIARNMALDALRRTHTSISLDDIEGMAASADVHTEDIETRLDIESALDSLDAKDREIVTLHVNGGLRFRELSEIIGLPLGTVLWRYQRALSELRKSLSGGKRK